MRKKVGINNYEAFAKERPPSRSATDPFSILRFLCDELNERERQAMKIASWARTSRLILISAIRVSNKLADKGVVLHYGYPHASTTGARSGRCAGEGHPAIVFRPPPPAVSPTGGRQPRSDGKEFADDPGAEAEGRAAMVSPRELLNVIEADENRCHMITATQRHSEEGVLMIGKDLTEFSRETVETFRRRRRRRRSAGVDFIAWLVHGEHWKPHAHVLVTGWAHMVERLGLSGLLAAIKLPSTTSATSAWIPCRSTILVRGRRAHS